MKFGRFGSFLKGNRKIISHCVCVIFSRVFFCWKSGRKNTKTLLHPCCINPLQERQNHREPWLGILVSAVFMDGQNGRKNWSRNVNFPRCCSVFQMFGLKIKWWKMQLETDIKQLSRVSNERSVCTFMSLTLATLIPPPSSLLRTQTLHRLRPALACTVDETKLLWHFNCRVSKNSRARCGCLYIANNQGFGHYSIGSVVYDSSKKSWVFFGGKAW